MADRAWPPQRRRSAASSPRRNPGTASSRSTNRWTPGAASTRRRICQPACGKAARRRRPTSRGVVPAGSSSRVCPAHQAARLDQAGRRQASAAIISRGPKLTTLATRSGSRSITRADLEDGLADAEPVAPCRPSLASSPVSAIAPQASPRFSSNARQRRARSVPRTCIIRQQRVSCHRPPSAQPSPGRRGHRPVSPSPASR